jgi:hypothetical protein
MNPCFLCPKVSPRAFALILCIVTEYHVTYPRVIGNHIQISQLHYQTCMKNCLIRVSTNEPRAIYTAHSIKVVSVPEPSTLLQLYISPNDNFM